MTSFCIRGATIHNGTELTAGASLIVSDGRIAWIGLEGDNPGDDVGESFDAGGRLVTAGLVECHTFLLHGGDRRAEWADRAGQAVTYVEQQNGRSGIAATVAATNAASDDELIAGASRRVASFIAEGATTIEVKSGYALTVEDQLRQLRLARRLDQMLPINIRVTMLAGHIYPPGVDQEEWVAAICDDLIPTAIGEGLVDQVEVYLDEDVGLDLDDSSSILETAYRKKIPTRLHTDHLSDSAGGALAPAFYTRAAGHLNYTDELGVATMAQSGTTAVLLPIAYLELGSEQRPPIEDMRTNDLPMAVSSGLNPGTAPLASLVGAAHWAVTVFGLTPDEAFSGITTAAARALDLDDGTGWLRAGGRADIAMWDVDHPHELIYSGTDSRLVASWVAGQSLVTTDVIQK